MTPAHLPLICDCSTETIYVPTRNWARTLDVRAFTRQQNTFISSYVTVILQKTVGAGALYRIRTI